MHKLRNTHCCYHLFELKKESETTNEVDLGMGIYTGDRVTDAQFEKENEKDKITG